MQASIQARCQSWIILACALLISAMTAPRTGPAALLAAESHALIHGFFFIFASIRMPCPLR